MPVMKYWVWFPLLLLPSGCGYKWIGWASPYRSIEIPRVEVPRKYHTMGVRLKDALSERCLVGSGLQPTDHDGDLTLTARLADYRENIIATDVDGRTQRIQFSMTISFRLVDREQRLIWSLVNYEYSDQYNIATTQNEYRDEGVFIQDQAMRGIADLAITNINLAINELRK